MLTISDDIVGCRRAKAARAGFHVGGFVHLKRLFAVSFSALILLPPNVFSQVAPAAPQGASTLASQSGALKINVLQGEGAKNNVRSRTSTAPVVEVRDEKDALVAGAEVVFQLPPIGPGGVFHGWLKNQTVRTNAEGQAAASGYTVNDEEGRFNIKVTATANNRTATAVIAQANVRGDGSSMSSGSPRRKWVTLGIIGAGILGGGIYAASRNGGSTPAAAVTNPVVITPGAITVGGPR